MRKADATKAVWVALLRFLAAAVGMMLVYAMLVAGDFVFGRSLELVIMWGVILTALAVTSFLSFARITVLHAVFLVTCTWALVRLAWYLWLVLTFRQ